ncbi:adenylyl-sulfate kinase [Petralouisia muris]|uniref:adenylyl-sulfate kinase n=1 Tax=Petralouisia muris TaxID=3032872 RepID=UPI0014416299|nr:adenylyl-sulfate kinase [Petralouisia muris]
MEKGVLYWITGLSGAGKTTVGTKLYYELRKTCPGLVILDGDILKKLVGDSLGYSREERLKRANYYSQMCKILTDQGITVIICTIAMYDSVREWNRKYIEKYVEVYLKVDREILMKRDKKGLYSRQRSGKVSEIAGLDIDVEYPKTPDVVIENDGSVSVRECVEKIMAYPVKQKDTFRRDVDYWNHYYAKKLKEIQSPSDFAQSVISHLEPGKSLIDLGCGNGRDSLYFMEHHLNVTGIDASEEAISQLNQLKLENGNFVCDDFVSSKALYQVQYDYIYSRWTMHAISEQQEDELLENVAEAVKEGGLFLIEARSIQDDLYGKGMCVGNNAFIYHEHFRRFMDKEIFIPKLENHGFRVISLEEGENYSKTETSNPVLVRIVASRGPKGE